LLLLPACSNAVPEASLVGNYIANYRGETATLVLKRDNTYVHTTRASDGRIVEEVATWKSTQREHAWDGRTVVEFWDFRLIPSFKEPDRGREKKAKIGWATEVELDWLWRIQLCFDSDVGYCYVKQPI
jgi:hypothetical protein